MGGEGGFFTLQNLQDLAQELKQAESAYTNALRSHLEAKTNHLQRKHYLRKERTLAYQALNAPNSKEKEALVQSVLNDEYRQVFRSHMELCKRKAELRAAKTQLDIKLALLKAFEAAIRLKEVQRVNENLAQNKPKPN